MLKCKTKRHFDGKNWQKQTPCKIPNSKHQKKNLFIYSPIQCCKPLNFYSCMTCTWHKRGERNATLKLAFFPRFFATFLAAHWQAYHAFHGNEIFFPICIFFMTARNWQYNWFLRKFDFQFSKISDLHNVYMPTNLDSYLDAGLITFSDHLSAKNMHVDVTCQQIWNQYLMIYYLTCCNILLSHWSNWSINA